VPRIADLTEILTDHGYRVVAYDHRGQGGSAASTRSDLSVDNLTADAVALIDALGLGRVHVAGNSLGGFVALRLAARHPDLLHSAVAMGSSAEEEHALPAFAPLVERMTRAGAGELVPTIMHIMFGDESLQAETPMTKHWSAYIAALGPSIGDCAHGVIHRDRIIEELAGCAVPVLAIAGAQDHTYPPPILSVNIAEGSGGRSITIDGAGHSVALERPQAVAEHLLAQFAAAEAG
jgi:3-oxoadipate enol-lactonase